MTTEDASLGLKALILALADKNLTIKELEAYLSQRKLDLLSEEERMKRFPLGEDVYVWVTKEAAYWNVENVSHRCFTTKKGASM